MKYFVRSICFLITISLLPLVLAEPIETYSQAPSDYVYEFERIKDLDLKAYSAVEILSLLLPDKVDQISSLDSGRGAKAPIKNQVALVLILEDGIYPEFFVERFITRFSALGFLPVQKLAYADQCDALRKGDLWILLLRKENIIIVLPRLFYPVLEGASAAGLGRSISRESAEGLGGGGSATISDPDRNYLWLGVFFLFLGSAALLALIILRLHTGRKKMAGLSFAPSPKLHPIRKDRVLLGRAKHCDFVIEGETISRQHAEITLSKTGYILTNLSRTNPTLVNDASVQSALLKNGDIIIISDHKITFFE